MQIDPKTGLSLKPYEFFLTYLRPEQLSQFILDAQRLRARGEYRKEAMESLLKRYEVLQPDIDEWMRQMDLAKFYDEIGAKDAVMAILKAAKPCLILDLGTIDKPAQSEFGDESLDYGNLPDAE